MSRPLAGNGGKKGKPQLPKPLELTALEIEALQWATSCATYAEVAAKCGIGTHAARSRIFSAFRKLGVTKLHLAILEANREGYLTIAGPEHRSRPL